MSTYIISGPSQERDVWPSKLGVSHHCYYNYIINNLMCALTIGVGNNRNHSITPYSAYLLKIISKELM
jgi:hypothetical protein